MSTFQKNTLLTFLILALVAYPPLYYSLRTAIQKHHTNLETFSEETTLFFSFADWEVRGEGVSSGTLQLTKEMVHFYLTLTENSVYLGHTQSIENPHLPGNELFLSGIFYWKDSGIQFTPKLYLLSKKNWYLGEPIFIPYEASGSLSRKIQNSFSTFLEEQFRLLHIRKRKIKIFIPSSNEDLSPKDFALLTSWSQTEDQGLQKEYLKQITNPSAFVQSVRLAKPNSDSDEALREWQKNILSDTFLPNQTKIFLHLPLAKLWKKKGNWNKIVESLATELDPFSSVGLPYSPAIAEYLFRIGEAHTQLGNTKQAILYASLAHSMFSSLRLLNSDLAIANQTFLGLQNANLGLYELSIQQLKETYEKTDLSINHIQQGFNLAKVLVLSKDFQSAKDILIQIQSDINLMGYTNLEIAFLAYNLKAYVHSELGEWEKATNIWESILSSKSALSLEEKPVYRYALYNLAVLALRRGLDVEKDSYYKQYTRFTPYSQIKDLSPSNAELGSFLLPNFDEIDARLVFTEWEEKSVRSSTGRYSFYGQEEEIRARTYENRLEDTNLFLEDLLESKEFKGSALLALQSTLFGKTFVPNQGQGILFFDIGPGLNHPDYPGVTSLAVAKRFPKMQVVLWELPTEVELFLKKVRPELKEKMYSYENIQILSADGVGDFMEVTSDPKNWILKQREIPIWKNKIIFIRAANSIDIYEPYPKIKAHFENIANVLKDQVVLYFFNRSIMLKPKGKTKFILIGNQSVRGFHHNFQSLDRNGEPPYYLMPFYWEQGEKR